VSRLQSQNLSNTAWAFATRRVLNIPFLEAISAAAIKIISEFDIQGIANTLWSFASLLLPHLKICSQIQRVVLSVISEAAPMSGRGPPFLQSPSQMYYEAARYQNHLCQMIWSLSFAACLGTGPVAEGLKGHLLACGQHLDESGTAYQHRRTTGLPKMKLPPPCLPDGPTKEPEMELRVRGIGVVMKPPTWEVDAKGQLSSSGYYLSHYMQREHHPEISPVLLLPEFEYGFIHRLDIPSSGLILTGTHFEGYALLQWQMHTYSIGREYAVLVGCLVPSKLRDINAPIHDFLPGRSFVDALQGRPAETHVKIFFHVARRMRFSCERFGLVCIAIHTGRRHQIRVHMQWEGHPTVTDEKYAHRAISLNSLGLEVAIAPGLRGLR